MVKAAIDMQQLYCDYYMKVYVYIRRKIGNSEDAEDLTQEVFEYCFKKYDTYDETKSRLSTWLFLIVNSRLKNFYRDKKSTECIDNYENILPATDNDMDRAVFLEQLKSALMEAMADLPQKQRDVVICKYFKGMSHGEIAEKFGISEGNSRVLLTRALDKMKGKMQAFSC